MIRTIPPPPAANHAATCRRASTLASGATASSRSRMIAPAPDSAALAKRSGR